MLDTGFYNEDCLPRMKEYPDNHFDLAIVDPPYGDGGDTQTDSVNGSTGTRLRFHGGGSVEQVHKSSRGGHDRHTSHQADERGNAHRTGGTWAAKFGKKLLRGMLRRGRNTLMNCSASHVIR